LVDVGYPDLTIDRVARRAGTNKNAIYRRWPNRAALAVAAFGQMAGSEAPIADTGDLRGDVLAVLRRINTDAASPAGIIWRSLISSIGDDPELRAQLLERIADDAATTWLDILGRAVARGEASPDALHPRVATAAIVLLRNEYITRGIGSTVPDSAVVEIVDAVYMPLIRGRGMKPV
jgi:AcrR family transcriptional regulator